MFTPSSSDCCVCEDPWCCAPTMNPMGTPFFPTMGQPLVYYAQVKRPPRNSDGKGPNSFMKAFRWYNQERYVNTAKEASPTNEEGFAGWLDAKYEEFLRESRQDQTALQPKPTALIQTSYRENEECECSKPSKFQRMKSPWRKRRSANKKKESGDAVSKPINQSFEFILHPKELQRPASQYHQTPTTCSSDTQTFKKVTLKSQSASSVREKEILLNALSMGEGSKLRIKSQIQVVQDLDVVPTEPVENYRAVTMRDICCQCPEQIGKVVTDFSQYDGRAADKNSSTYFAAPSSVDPKVQSLSKTDTSKKGRNVKKRKSKESHKGVSCQCSEANIKKDAQIQYQPLLFCDRPCFCDTKWTIEEITSQESKTIPAIQYKQITTRTSIARRDVECGVQNPASLADTHFAVHASQTSDHSIRLEEETIRQYPLFMKIICADKLHEEYCNCR